MTPIILAQFVTCFLCCNFVVSSNLNSPKDAKDLQTLQLNEFNLAKSRHVKNFQEKNKAAESPQQQQCGNGNDTAGTELFGEGGSGVKNIIELLIFCDMDFAKAHDNDYERILDYWTRVMWDANMRFQTLERVKISIRTVGVLVATSKEDQSFIESARKNGVVDLGQVNSNFPNWAYQKRRNGAGIPNFDMALVAIRGDTSSSWLGWNGVECETPYTTMSIRDYGWTTPSRVSAALGMSLGASFDTNEYRGYIMDQDRNSDSSNRFFFSPASDTSIRDYVGTNYLNCLRKIDEPNSLRLPQDYETPLAPSMQSQCRGAFEDSTAYTEVINGTSMCTLVWCVSPNGGYRTSLQPLDNSPCGRDKRCFRGSCQQQGHILRNVGTGLCLRSKDPFSTFDNTEMFKCPRVGSPVDRWVISPDAPTRFSSPFSKSVSNNNNQRKETSDKCLFTYAWQSDDELYYVFSDDCKNDDSATWPWYGWNMTYVGSSQFLLVHRKFNRCARPSGYEEGGKVVADKNCNTNNQLMRWTIYL